MADANLRVTACPECGQEGSGIRTQPVVGRERTRESEPDITMGGDHILLVMWCQYCGWFTVNNRQGESINHES